MSSGSDGVLKGGGGGGGGGQPEGGGAQRAGEPGRAGDEVDGEPGDGVPQRLHRVGGEPLPGPAAGAGRGPGRGGPAAGARDTQGLVAVTAVRGVVTVAVARAGLVTVTGLTATGQAD